MFIKTIKDSIYGPQFYGSLRDLSIKSSFGHFIKFVLVIAVIWLATMCIYAYPVIGVFKQAANQVNTLYPTDLVISIKGGEASINKPTPLAIPMPKLSTNEKDLPGNLLVIDTQSVFSTEKFNAYNSVIVLFKDSVAAIDNKSGIRVGALKGTKDIDINQKMAQDFITSFAAIMPIATIIAVVVLFIGIILLLFVWNSIYLLLIALPIWLVMYMTKNSWGYWKAYQVGLHAITASILLSTISIIGAFTLPTFACTILTLVIVILNFSKQKRELQVIETAQATN